MGSVAFSDQVCSDTRCAERDRQLIAAVEHRGVIGTAKGLLMSSANCSADDAFGILRAESQHRNVKLWQVAERIVATTSAAQLSSAPA